MESRQMDVPPNFKFDVRIRNRMLAKRTITEADVEKHLEALEDRQDKVQGIELVQPALTNPEDRPTPPASAPVPTLSAEPRPFAAPVPAAERSAPRSIAPGPLPVDEGWDDEDDDDDDDDEVEAVKAKPPVEAPKPVVEAVKVAPQATLDVEADDEAPVAKTAESDDADEDEDEDDEDEDDEDEDDEDEDDEEEEKEDGADAKATESSDDEDGAAKGEEE
jgi:hypothetical protein